jgi:ABC-type lipoprotein export system ATPase subunit
MQAERDVSPTVALLFAEKPTGNLEDPHSGEVMPKLRDIASQVLTPVLIVIHVENRGGCCGPPDRPAYGMLNTLIR